MDLIVNRKEKIRRWRQYVEVCYAEMFGCETLTPTDVGQFKYT
jgi:hypothetical protein